MATRYQNLSSAWKVAKGRIRYEPKNAETIVREALDSSPLNGFQWIVWAVASSGFFTTSYSIFSTNVIVPALMFLYPNCGHQRVEQSLIINLTTLCGTLIGMVLFGFLADRHGRNSIYGVELVIVLIATVGMISATSGKGDVMDIYGWVGFWRFFLGIGLGAEYPLSAIIAAEWSSTETRGRMMAAMFLMQSLGQLTSYALGLLVLFLTKIARKMDSNADHPQADPIIEVFWRVYIAIGVVPILLSIVLRRQLPETAVWLVSKGKGHDAKKALNIVNPEVEQEQAERLELLVEGLQNPPQGPDTMFEEPDQHQFSFQTNHQPGVRPDSASFGPHEIDLGYDRHSPYQQDHPPSPPPPPPPPPKTDSNEHSMLENDIDDEKSLTRNTIDYLVGVWTYLRDDDTEGKARYDRLRILLGVMIVWFLLDFAFHGLGLDSPRTISRIWLSVDTDDRVPTCEEGAWRTNPAEPDISIYDMIKENTIRDMITISTGTVSGSVLILLVIDYIPRVSWMACWFLALAALFVVNGAIFFVAYESDKYALTITLYVLAHLIFNLGPNTITFILPAELFNTRYRGTFYGLAAASGKLGAIMIQVFQNQFIPLNDKTKFSILLLGGLGPAMLIGAIVTWAWIPEVQLPCGHHKPGEAPPHRWVRPNRTLEEIAEPSAEGQVIGFRKRLRRVYNSEGGSGQVRRKNERDPESVPVVLDNYVMDGADQRP